MSEAFAYQDEYYDEMLDGKIFVMAPRPRINHIRASGGISTIFQRYLKGKKCEFFSEPDVYLSDKDRPVPDAVVVCNKDIIKYNGIHGAPDLVIEILSPSTAKRDKGYKMNLYEKHGVKEYWIVDIKNLSIEVYLLKDGKFELDNVYAVYPDYVFEGLSDEEISKRKKEVASEFSPSMFPDLTVSLREVFEGLID